VLHRNITVNLNDWHARPTREQLREDTAVPGIEVLHQDERHSGIGWQIFEQLRESFESSSGRANADDQSTRWRRYWCSLASS